ncbi:MAG: hypothetical protein IJA85_05325 [Clostridia bacterium]|nr:hypothetical protein [Clostridia bacterium]
MTDILLLGSFHFLQTKIDIFSEDSQSELSSLCDRLSAFHPDAICVEAGAQEDIDILYNALDPMIFCDSDKMRRTVLGEITLYGQRYPVTLNNEAIQIGFRLGKLCGLDRIYAIDEELILDESLLAIDTPEVRDYRAGVDSFMHEVNSHETESVLSQLRYFNSSEFSRKNHDVIYKSARKICREGEMMYASWYERNVKIFEKLKAVADGHNRVCIVYGAGHLKLLKDFIKHDADMRLINADEYLK